VLAAAAATLPPSAPARGVSVDYLGSLLVGSATAAALAYLTEAPYRGDAPRYHELRGRAALRHRYVPAQRPRDAGIRPGVRRGAPDPPPEHGPAGASPF